MKSSLIDVLEISQRFVDRTARFTYEGNWVKNVDSSTRGNKQSVPSIWTIVRSYSRRGIPIPRAKNQRN